jgi:hypothetical protein
MRWGMQHLQRACRGHVGYFKLGILYHQYCSSSGSMNLPYMAHRYFVPGAVCSACRFGVNGILFYFSGWTAILFNFSG